MIDIRHAALAALTLAILAACGGGGSAGTSAGAPPPPAASLPLAPPAVAETCSVNNVSYAICTADNGGWAFEGGKYCIARSFCPANRTAMPTGAGREAPLDPLANPKTVATYRYLRSVWGSKILSGQQDLTWMDSADMAARVFADTGKYPAIMGYDFMNYGMKHVDGRQQTEEAIAYAARGGLVAFAWHWRDPSKLKTAPNEAMFYVNDSNPANNTAFTIPVSQGQLDKSSPAYQQLNDGIDLIAVELKKLSDAGVTVLWRPLHEASGWQGKGWFWWGRARSDGVPQAFANILLWRHMHERLVNVHGLHNLIWVWNGQDPAWYPGDNVVDVMSMDVYDDSDRKQYRSQIEAYQALQRTTNERKIVAMSENSYIPDPDRIAADGAWWAWFMVWNDGSAGVGVDDKTNFWTGEYYNTNAHKRKVYNHPAVITLDELPKL